MSSVVSRFAPPDILLLDSLIDPHLHAVGQKQEEVRKPSLIVDSAPRLSAIDVLGKSRELLGPRDTETAALGYVHDSDVLSVTSGRGLGKGSI